MNPIFDNDLNKSNYTFVQPYQLPHLFTNKRRKILTLRKAVYAKCHKIKRLIGLNPKIIFVNNLSFFNQESELQSKFLGTKLLNAGSIRALHLPIPLSGTSKSIVFRLVSDCLKIFVELQTNQTHLFEIICFKLFNKVYLRNLFLHKFFSKYDYAIEISYIIFDYLTFFNDLFFQFLNLITRTISFHYLLLIPTFK